MFDRKEGERLRDKGIKQTAEAAANQAWVTEADLCLRAICSSHKEFTSDDVWKLLHLAEIPPPPGPMAMGAVFRSAALAGLCEKTGRYIKTNRPSAHRRDLAVWRSLTYGYSPGK